MLKNDKIRLIYVSAPPFSSLLIATILKMLTNVKIVIDYRDEWVTNELWKYRFKYRKRIDKYFEHFVLKRADAILSVSQPILDNIRESYGVSKDKFSVIPNGFDPEDFKIKELKEYNKFTISYIGTLYKKRTPKYFLKALKNLLIEEKELRKKIQFMFVGRVDRECVEIINESGVQALVKLIGYVSHKESMQYMLSSHILLLILDYVEGCDRFSTDKIFEYMASGRPILTLVPDSVIKNLINSTKTGIVVSPYDVVEIKNVLKELFIKSYVRREPHCPDWEKINNYTRKEATKILCGIFSALVEP